MKLWLVFDDGGDHNHLVSIHETKPSATKAAKKSKDFYVEEWETKP